MKSFRRKKRLMGSDFELIMLHDNEQYAHELLDLSIQKIEFLESLLSEFKENSDTWLINNSLANANIQINELTYELIKRSIAISKLTHGTFDITTKPLKKLYNFKQEKFIFPTEEEINETLQIVGYQNIVINESSQTISKKIKEVSLSFAAIGKGFASDVIKQFWLQQGIAAGCINAGGDLNAFGYNLNKEAWQVGIANPKDPDEILMSLPIENLAVATSGDYIQNFNYNGILYGHNIDPKSGYPLHNHIKSVTVITQSAELADALATAVYVKGIHKGTQFINQLPNTHSIIIDENNKIYFSAELE